MSGDISATWFLPTFMANTLLRTFIFYANAHTFEYYRTHGDIGFRCQLRLVAKSQWSEEIQRSSNFSTGRKNNSFYELRNYLQWSEVSAWIQISDRAYLMKLRTVQLEVWFVLKHKFS